MAHEHSNLGAWIARLRERDPDVSLKEVYEADARTIGGDEREVPWRELVARYPVFDDYQQATAREIPVVHLARRPEVAR